MFDLIAILIPIVLAVCIVLVVKIIEDGRVRRRCIEADADPELVRTLLVGESASRRGGSLKWGVVTLVIGLAFAAIWALGLPADSPLSYALVFVGAGAGMLLHRALERPGR